MARPTCREKVFFVGGEKLAKRSRQKYYLRKAYLGFSEQCETHVLFGLIWFSLRTLQVTPFLTALTCLSQVWLLASSTPRWPNSPSKNVKFPFTSKILRIFNNIPNSLIVFSNLMIDQACHWNIIICFSGQCFNVSETVLLTRVDLLQTTHQSLVLKWKITKLEWIMKNILLSGVLRARRK